MAMPTKPTELLGRGYSKEEIETRKYNEEKLAQERIPGADSPKELLEKAKSYQHKK